MEIADEIPWSGSRKTILAKAWPRPWEDGTDVSAAAPAMCKIWLDRRAVSSSRRGASAKPQAILVHPGDNVVRETDFITSRDDVEANATTVAGGSTNETVDVRDDDGGVGDSSPANARPSNDEATGPQHNSQGGGRGGVCRGEVLRSGGAVERRGVGCGSRPDVARPRSSHPVGLR